ncbi:MAG: hypothetical protein KJ619_02455 [Candidatus Omnitrophica bacterium]|nr:hypothetical protein [Candidatus Omnitrophota bacterium]
MNFSTQKQSCNKDTHCLCFIEELTLSSYLFYVLPYLLKKKPQSIKKDIYVIDTSKAGFVLAGFISRILGFSFRKLEFRIIDIKDDSGNLIRLRLDYFDFAEVQKDILSRDIFKKLDSCQEINKKTLTFLTKRIANLYYNVNSTVWRAQLLIQLALWKTKEDSSAKDTEKVLFINKRMWWREIKKYSSKYKVELIPIKNWHINLRDILVRLSGAKLKLFQSICFFIKREGLIKFLRQTRAVFPARNPSPKLAVQYYGHLNLAQPELTSDLFFWQNSSLSAEDIVINFNFAEDPLDKKKLQEVEQYDMRAIALSPDAVEVPNAEVFYHRKCNLDVNYFKSSLDLSKDKAEKKWLKQQLAYFVSQYNYWFDFFTSYNGKIYLTWYKYGHEHCIIADVLEKLGGVLAIYQRAFEEFSSMGTTIVSDIVFGFSSRNADIERRSGSLIPYHVAVGYFGDHRFPLLKKPAQAIRNKLKESGAKYILAYFDEGSADDSRWHTGHEFMRENYSFLLERVLSEPELGIIFKPKVPTTLRLRLGKVAELLKRAEETGRCLVIEGGLLHGWYPPALAAIACDVAVHGHLCVATAGVESALAGAPTLLLDREGWKVSSLYRLGTGRVVFTDWQNLWKTCSEYWNNASSMPEFGNWSSILDEIDPFRDGRAAERIGTYLKWLLDGFKAKLPREKVLADAAERYGNIWGHDKVRQVFQGTVSPFKAVYLRDKYTGVL